MVHLTIDTGEFDSLHADAQKAFDELEVDLGNATEQAADAGVGEAQHNHPYQDHSGSDGLTETAIAERTGPMESEMQWPKPYAGFVDKGTSRAKPYAFTPQAEKVAEEVLERRAEIAIERFIAKVSR